VLAIESLPTGSDGVYTLNHISPLVNYKIKVSPSTAQLTGDVGQWYSNPQVPAYLIQNATPISLPVTGSAFTQTGVNVLLRAGQTISGKVTGTNFPGGVQNVEVSVYDASKPISLTSPVFVTTTDSVGNFSFPNGLDAGNYKVFYRPFGAPDNGGGNPQHIAGWFSDATSNPALAASIGITVDTNGTFFCNGNPLHPSCIADQLLPLGSLIYGNIMFSPKPVLPFTGQVKISVYKVSTGTLVQEFFRAINANTLTNNGTTLSYLTAPLNDGTYRIQITQSGSSGVPEYLGGYYLAGSSPNFTSVYTAATDIVIAGGSSGSYDVIMVQGAALVVHVQSRSDTGVLAEYSGVDVRVTDPNNQNIVRASSTTDSSGLAHFTSLQAQPYGIYIVPPGSGAPDFSVPVTPLVSGGTITVTRVITRSAFITGILKVTGDAAFNFGDLSTTPLVLEAFKYINGDTLGSSVPVYLTQLFPNQDGTFTYVAKLQGGKYNIKFTIPGYLPQYYSISYNVNTNSPVDSKIDQFYYNVNADFQPGGALKIRVMQIDTTDPLNTAKDTPFTGGANVQLFNSNAASATPLSVGTMKTDSQGYVSHIPVLSANGPYYFRVDDNTTTDSKFQTIYYSKRLTITDAVGLPVVNNAVQNVTVRVAPKGQITGTVTYLPPVGPSVFPNSFKVTAYDEGTKELITSVTVNNSLDGSYTLNLPQGQYTIKFDDLQHSLTGYWNGQTIFHNPLNVQATTPNINYNFLSGACSILPNYTPGAASTSTLLITYFTNCPGTTRVTYSTTPGGAGTSFPVNPSDSVLQHDSFVTGLQPNTTYYFKLFSTPKPLDPNGNPYPELAYNGTNPYVQSTPAVEIAMRTAPDGKVWYFAAGDTNNSATDKTTEVLHILNHNITSTVVNISYYGTTGLISSTTKNIPAQQRVNVTVNTDLAPLQVDHSTVVSVTSGPDISVERTLYTERTTAVGLTTNGGYTMLGSPGPSNDWYFADVSTNLFNDNYFSIFNPNLVTGCIRIRYFDNPGIFYDEKVGISVPPLAKLHIKVKDPTYQPANGLKATDFGVQISSIQTGCLSSDKASFVPLLVEQESYYSDITGTPRKGVSGKFGSTALQSNWIYSDGLNPMVDNQSYVFLNPSFVTTTVTLNYQLERAPLGFSSIVTVQVPPLTRLSVPITNPNIPQFGRAYGFTIQMQANAGIAVERVASYQLAPVTGYDGTFTENAYWRNAKAWLFAGGDTINTPGAGRSGDLSYIVVNPNITAANISITYFFTDGSAPISKTIQIAPNSRVSLPAGVTLNNNPGIGPDKIVGVRIDSDQAIAAERIFYWRFGNWVGGNATFGYIPPGS
jgi:hypothetical protein